MSIFKKFFKKKVKVDAQKMIKDFEIGRYTLLQHVNNKMEKLKKEGYNVLTVNPVLVSVGKANEESPYGVIISTDNNTFNEFHKYIDIGKYEKSEINMFIIGEYIFMMAVSMDNEKKLAIIYPSAFRKEKFEEIQKSTTLYIYVLSIESQKYTLVYIPNIKWSEPKSMEGTLIKSGESKSPPPTLYR
ncbi:MAG: hypothetical protein N3E39_00890 [Candidatus Methanomethylicia archaeon]|nr:hypothetical protein [Candidatus Methanomethylicia archaeon]MDW7988503.1 hypothetical protein [Nitrososphaerota archaeon]